MRTRSPAVIRRIRPIRFSRHPKRPSLCRDPPSQGSHEILRRTKTCGSRTDFQVCPTEGTWHHLRWHGSCISRQSSGDIHRPDEISTPPSHHTRNLSGENREDPREHGFASETSVCNIGRRAVVRTTISGKEALMLSRAPRRFFDIPLIAVRRSWHAPQSR